MEEVQIRNMSGATIQVESVKRAFEIASIDEEVWKISWAEGDHRIRLVRQVDESEPRWKRKPDSWVYQPIITR